MGPCFGARRQLDIRPASRRRIFDVTSVTLRENVALMRHPATTCSAVEWRRQGLAAARQSRESKAVTGAAQWLFLSPASVVTRQVLLSPAPYSKMAARAVLRPAPSRTVALRGGGSAVWGCSRVWSLRHRKQ